MRDARIFDLNMTLPGLSFLLLPNNPVYPNLHYLPTVLLLLDETVTFEGLPLYFFKNSGEALTLELRKLPGLIWVRTESLELA